MTIRVRPRRGYVLLCVAECMAMCSCAWLRALVRGYVSDREIEGYGEGVRH